jgi:hypothetical protein
MQPTSLNPSGLEAVSLEWDDSSYGTPAARGNVWSTILTMTVGRHIQSFTIPGSTNMQCRLSGIQGNILVTITS